LKIDDVFMRIQDEPRSRCVSYVNITVTQSLFSTCGSPINFMPSKRDIWQVLVSCKEISASIKCGEIIMSRYFLQDYDILGCDAI
jgi:hypothetical protein